VDVDVRSLREWRFKRALGQRELARLAGISVYTLLNLEHGRSRGYPQTWRKIAAVLQVEPEQIAEYRAAVGLDTESA
jgi:transcriptional regulator with XRE-family HTH domain